MTWTHLKTTPAPEEGPKREEEVQPQRAQRIAEKGQRAARVLDAMCSMEERCRGLEERCRGLEGDKAWLRETSDRNDLSFGRAYHDLQLKCEKLDDQLREMKRERDHYSAEEVQARAEAARWRVSANEWSESTNRLNGVVQSLTGERDEARADISNLKCELEGARKDAKNWKREADAEQASAIRASRERDDARAEADRWKSRVELVQHERDESREVAERLKDKLVEAQEELGRVRSAAVPEDGALHAEVELLRADLEEVRRRRDQAREDILALEQDLKAARAKSPHGDSPQSHGVAQRNAEEDVRLLLALLTNTIIGVRPNLIVTQVGGDKDRFELFCRSGSPRLINVGLLPDAAVLGRLLRGDSRLREEMLSQLQWAFPGGPGGTAFRVEVTEAVAEPGGPETTSEVAP